jgi:hypothetical protein
MRYRTEVVDNVANGQVGVTYSAVHFTNKKKVNVITEQGHIWVNGITDLKHFSVNPIIFRIFALVFI